MIAIFAGALVASASGQQSNPNPETKPDELKRNDNQQSAPEPVTEIPSIPSSIPSSNDNNSNNIDDDESEADNEYFGFNNDVAPYSPFNLYNRPSLFNLGGFFQQMMNNMRQQHRQMQQEFNRLQQQGAQGIEQTKVNINGVAYKRTCTYERIQWVMNQSGSEDDMSWLQKNFVRHLFLVGTIQ